MKYFTQLKRYFRRAAFVGGASLLATPAFAAADFTPLSDAISGEQAGIVGVILAVAAVLAAVYAVKRGAGIGLSAIKGR